MNRYTILMALVFAGSELQAQQSKQLATFKGHTFAVDRVALSPDGTILASGGGDTRGGELKLWDAVSGKEITSLEGYSNSLMGLAFSPDGKLLASAGLEPVKLWSVAERKKIATLQSGPDYIYALAFSPDCKRLAAAGDRDVMLWDVATGKLLRSFKRLVRAERVAFNHGLTMLASPNYEDIDLWGLSSGEEPRVLSDHRGTVTSVAFSADGKSLIASSTRSTDNNQWIGEVKFWDVATARERSKVRGQFGMVTHLVLNKEGNYLMLVDWKDIDEDAELKIIDLSTGISRVFHKGFHRSLYSLGFRSQNKFWFASSAGTIVQLWEVPLLR